MVSPPKPSSRPSSGSRDADAIVLTNRRLVVMSVVTSGLFFFYWVYLTWRQLRAETQDLHFPFWHALSLLVPVYGLFRLYRHLKLIKDLCLKTGVETSLSPAIGVFLVALNGVLGFRSQGVESPEAVLFLSALGFVIMTTLMVWAQAALNSYWRETRGDSLTTAAVETGERFFLVVGGLLWLTVLF